MTFHFSEVDMDIILCANIHMVIQYILDCTLFLVKKMTIFDHKFIIAVI